LGTGTPLVRLITLVTRGPARKGHHTQLRPLTAQMSVLPLWTSIVCCASYFAAQLGILFIPPPSLTQPVVSRYLGRLTFLTNQTNLICFLYYLASVMNALAVVDLDAFLVGWFPLIFSLGLFLTPAYYGLDHFNKKKIEIRQLWARKGYPHITFGSNLIHGLSLPTTLLAVLFFGTAPTTKQVLSAELYIFFYLVLIIVNRLATGEYVYPFIADAQRKMGLMGPVLVLGVLFSIGVSFGFLGALIVSVLRG